MARKPSTPRLPNGYGSIRRITGKVQKYGVYPPQLEEDINGKRLPVKALCYVPSWAVGFAVLTAYHAGTYVPGMEHDMIEADLAHPATAENMGVIRRIMDDYTRIRRSLLNQPEPGQTFAQIYELWYADKFDSGKLSEQNKRATRSAFRNLSALHDRPIREITIDEAQAVIDGCTLGESSIGNMLICLKGVYKFAESRDLVSKNISNFVRIKDAKPSEHGVPFTEEELRILWDHRADPVCELAVIMCYAGYRISAYQTLEVNLKQRYFRGGNKTESGRNLLTPIHPAIYTLVKRRISAYGSLLPESPNEYRKSFYGALEGLGIEKHTPHDCKHTFSALCERYGVNENDRKRLLGHRIGNVTNDVYGHRTLDDLRAELVKIPSPEKFESLSKAGQDLMPAE